MPFLLYVQNYSNQPDKATLFGAAPIILLQEYTSATLKHALHSIHWRVCIRVELWLPPTTLSLGLIQSVFLEGVWLWGVKKKKNKGSKSKKHKIMFLTYPQFSFLSNSTFKTTNNWYTPMRKISWRLMSTMSMTSKNNCPQMNFFGVREQQNLAQNTLSVENQILFVRSAAALTLSQP